MDDVDAGLAQGVRHHRQARLRGECLKKPGHDDEGVHGQHRAEEVRVHDQGVHLGEELGTRIIGVEIPKCAVAAVLLHVRLQSRQLVQLQGPEEDENEGVKDAHPVYCVCWAHVNPGSFHTAELPPVSHQLDALFSKELQDEDNPHNINKPAPPAMIGMQVEAHRLHNLVDVATAIQKQVDVSGGDEVLVRVVGREEELHLGRLWVEPHRILELAEPLPHLGLGRPGQQVDRVLLAQVVLVHRDPPPILGHKPVAKGVHALARVHGGPERLVTRRTVPHPSLFLLHAHAAYDSMIEEVGAVDTVRASKKCSRPRCDPWRGLRRLGARVAPEPAGTRRQVLDPGLIPSVPINGLLGRHAPLRSVHADLVHIPAHRPEERHDSHADP
mmetsp:Transcript_11406/g.33409  ORF Transcript_11406/g.33409 Transcript_11406/m.33409 type:complete len:385 (+) Transcript_11406:1902-3056(+)